MKNAKINIVKSIDAGENAQTKVVAQNPQTKKDPLEETKKRMTERGVLKFFLASLDKKNWQTALD